MKTKAAKSKKNEALRNKTKKIINKYYPKNDPARPYFKGHVKAVKKAAFKILKNNPSIKADKEKIRAMALLHDIGMRETYAPAIGCYGKHKYLEHGYLGRAILEKEGMGDIAPICERHVGVGITKAEIIEKKLPLPHRNMIPLSMEEKIVCYADKFFSKSDDDLMKPKSFERVLNHMRKLGKGKLFEFTKMTKEFGFDYLYKELD